MKFSQEFWAANIFVKHSAFENFKIDNSYKIANSPSSQNYYENILTAQNQNDPPITIVTAPLSTAPSLCSGGFYWQHGGLPSTALVRGNLGENGQVLRAEGGGSKG